ncbi:MAG: hybrid sensor histidine kinase/response regulator [Marinilabiliaceae bacterium]|nr:hybrid sensor histidine kinase/response regulator [Marinilabiliaceae bacterium]
MEQNLSVINDLLPILTTSETGVWICDVNTKKLQFKNDFFNILDIKKDGFDFSTLEELQSLISQEDRQIFDDAFNNAVLGKTASINYCCLNKDGLKVKFETTFLNCNDGVVACTVNISEKQQNHDWEKQYRTLVNALFPNFIFVWDKDFYYLDVIIPDGLRLFHTREELIGQDARQYYTKEVSDLLIANIQESLRTNKPKDVEHHIELHGTRYFYQTRIVPIDGERAFCLIQDIGDRVRRMEELLTQRHRAEESSRLKSILIDNMSHEIRTPLNGIVGFSELLLDEQDYDIRKNYLEIIRGNNTMLLQIINDILDLSRLDSSLYEFVFEDVDIDAMIKEVTELYTTLKKPEIQLLIEKPDTEIRVMTDANRMKQVIYNLVTNALKFTKQGSVTLKVEEKDDFLTFSVIDTGSGIPEDKIDTIFERFEKLSRLTQGTGLGLSICKSIVERLGGKIWVTSKIDEGSTFSFTIPYRNVLNPETIGDTHELMANKRKKVMVVEKSKEDIQHINTILSKKYDVIEITDFDKIVSTFILNQPNLVLMSMEASSKKEIITKIKALTPTIPIIAITTSDFYYDQRLAIENGCTDVIVKPFSPSKLEELIMAFIF